MKPTEDVANMLKTVEGQAQFLEWSRNPITQMLISAARYRALPAAGLGPQSASFTERSLAAHFYSIGANETIDFLLTPVSTLVKDATQAALDGNYGASYIMQKFGHEPVKQERSA